MNSVRFYDFANVLKYSFNFFEDSLKTGCVFFLGHHTTDLVWFCCQRLPVSQCLFPHQAYPCNSWAYLALPWVEDPAFLWCLRVFAASYRISSGNVWKLGIPPRIVNIGSPPELPYICWWFQICFLFFPFVNRFQWLPEGKVFFFTTDLCFCE